jgi:hypothetical protein
MDDSSIKNNIYEKLNNKELTSNLEIIIKNNSIPHTTNKNGTFINISVLERDHLLIIYNYLMSESESENPIQKDEQGSDHLDYDILKTEEDIKPITKSHDKNIKLTPLQQKIVSYSL